MQIKQLALAVAATLIAGQAGAAAVTQAQIAAARAAGTLQETWVSGNSAPAYNIYDGFALGCDVNSVHVFTNNATAGKPGSIGNISAYACTRGGKVSVMYHNLDGGSFNAYAPHLPASLGVAPDGTSLPAYLSRVKNLGTVTCTVSGSYSTAGLGVSYSTTGSIPVEAGCSIVNPHTAPDGAVAHPAGGFSDVEAGLFGYDVSAYGTESDALVTQVFGVAVTPALYRQLQVSQGIYASVTAANTSDASYDPANAPNITSAQYASIVESGGGYQTDWSPILGAAGTGHNVILARRTPTSGTQATSNAFFLKNPCATGIGGAVASARATDSTSTFTVTEASSTGGVKTAMTNANNSTNANNTYAIGVLSLENNWRSDAAASSGYRFVKLDGVHPEAGDTTLAINAGANGNYNMVSEMKMFVGNDADTFGATLIPQIQAALGNPTSCTTNVLRGMFLNPTGGSSCTVGVQVGKGTKFGNNCAPVQLFF